MTSWLKFKSEILQFEEDDVAVFIGLSVLCNFLAFFGLNLSYMYLC